MSYEVAISAIPAGWSLYSPSITSNEFKNSNSGYVSEIDAFVVRKTMGDATYLALIKCGTTDLMFDDQAITAIRVSNGLMVLKNANGEMYVTDYDGNVVLDKVVSGASSMAIDSTIKVLDNELIAVNPVYDKNATDNKAYTSIYRASTGKVATRVKNAGGALSALAGFDGKYVVVSNRIQLRYNYFYGIFVNL